MRQKKGHFITFEKTGEGLGGTTQAQLLAENLRKLGYEVVLTREPGGTDLGTILRDILLKYKGEMSKACELFLYQADRAQHYKEVIKPALQSGKVVISDRYLDSTLGWQGSGRGWKRYTLWKLHEIATNSLLPDITFILDGVSMRTPDPEDRFEKLALSTNFFERVRMGMLNQAKTDARYVVLNANQPKEVLGADILNVVRDRLSL